MATSAETRINLTALKRQDPYISDIIDSSTQVAVYTFNHQTEQWEKTGVEGALFVYSRLAPPVAGFTIMNRLSMNNLTEPLTSEMDFQNQDPFLLYRNAKLAIFGIWFYDMFDCHRIGKLLAELCKNSKTAPVNIPSAKNVLLPSANSSSPSTSSSLSEPAIEEEAADNQASSEESGIMMKVASEEQSSVDIMDILCKAKDVYNKNRGKYNQGDHEPKNKKSNPKVFKPVSVKSDPKKLNVASLFGQPDQVKRPSSADVFTAATEPGNAPTSQSEIAQSHRRYASRSQSLSLANEQVHSRAPHTIVNGAISVEELESPVLGLPAQRARYHSISEGGPRNRRSPSLPVAEDIAPFHKLLGKMANLAATDKNAVTEPRAIPKKGRGTYPSDYVNAANYPLVNSSSQNVHHPKSNLQRSLSTPSGIGKYNAKAAAATQSAVNGTFSLASVASTSAASISPSMPTLHENMTHATATKSASVASGLSRLSNPARHRTVQVAAALHGTNKKNQLPLLSPNVLQLNVQTPAATTSLSYSKMPFDPAATSVSVSSTSTISALSSAPEPKTLISPEDFEHSTATPQKAMELRQRLLSEDSFGENRVVLDKNQLAKTLICLLQNDSSFVDAIYKAYLTGLENSHNKLDATQVATLSSLYKRDGL